ncbi:MAG: hypothetical protein K6T66_15260 [Peptococcaceae bacterium]|nr:hypothetical protein [Peptococcaceae bacterium]
MRVEIDLPLLLPYVEEIRQRLLDQAAGAEKIIFTKSDLDAAGIQLIVAVRKEFPSLKIEIAPGQSGKICHLLLLKEVNSDV